MSTAQAEIGRKVADILDMRPEKVNLSNWISIDDETASIAGHVALLFEDIPDRDSLECQIVSDEWQDRQASRLGLPFAVGEELFSEEIYLDMPPNSLHLLSKMLRDIADTIESREDGDMLTVKEFAEIKKAALSN